MSMALNRPIESWVDKRVWVVGASSGIGAALAKRLLQEGAIVALSARSVPLLAEVASSQLNAHVVPLDVTQTAAWPVAMAQVLERLGHID